MKKTFPTSFVYITPLTKPYLDCSRDKIKVAHIRQEIGSYEKLDFSKLEKEAKKWVFQKQQKQWFTKDKIKGRVYQP